MDRFLKFADLAQVPFTVAAYVGAAYALVIFLEKYGVAVPWQVVAVIGVIVVGLGATAVQVAALRMVRRQVTISSSSPTIVRTSAEAPTVVASSKVSERVFVDVTPQELTKPFDTYVAAQAERLLQPYIGKWFRVTGPISNVHQHENFWQVFTPFYTAPNRLPQHISLNFSVEWSGRLSVLARDATITAIGEIERIDSSTIFLRNCELA